MPYNQLKQTGFHLHETEKNQGKQSFFFAKHRPQALLKNSHKNFGGISAKIRLCSEAHLEHSQTSKTVLFAKTVNC